MRPLRRLSHRVRAGERERGATLVYALLFITVISVVVAAVASTAGARLRTTVNLRDQAATACSAVMPMPHPGHRVEDASSAHAHVVHTRHPLARTRSSRFRRLRPAIRTPTMLAVRNGATAA